MRRRPFDIEAGDVAVEELFVIGGRGEQSDADLETVRRGVPVSHFMVFHVPQVAELVVGTAGRSARLVRLHRETAQHEPFDQRPDRFDGTLAHPFRIAERILQSVLDDCESAFVERLHAQCIRNDPVCTRRDFGEQVGLIPLAVISFGAAAIIAVSASTPNGAGHEKVCLAPSKVIDAPNDV